MQKARKHYSKCKKKQCHYNSARLIEVEEWYKDARAAIQTLIKEKEELKKAQQASREERLLAFKSEITHSMSVAMESLAHVIDERHLGK